MKSKAILVSLIFLSGVAAAQIQQPTSTQQKGLQGLKESYNQQTESVPGFLANIVGGETININLEAGNNTKTLGVKFDGVEIENISKEEMENPTMKANISREAIASIGQADKPYKELQNQMKTGNIEYKTTTLEAGIKIKIVETLGGIASTIGNILR